MHYLQSLCNKKYDVVTINFFGEYHGKSHVDAHFGVLQKALNDAEKTIFINSIDDLNSFFSSKFSNNYYFFKKYEREKRLYKIKKIKIKNFNSFLSFIFNKFNYFYSSFSSFHPNDYIQENPNLRTYL